MSRGSAFTAWAVTATLVVPLPLRSQSPAPSDTTYAIVRAALREAQDTLGSVLAASWEFGKDLPGAGPETVLARAAVLRDRCQSGERVVSRMIQVTVTRPMPAGARRRADSLRAASRRLAAALVGDCVHGFTPPPRGSGAADSVRAWGPFWSQRIERAIHEFEASARQFAGALGFKLEAAP